MNIATTINIEYLIDVKYHLVDHTQINEINIVTWYFVLQMTELEVLMVKSTFFVSYQFNSGNSYNLTLRVLEIDVLNEVVKSQSQE